MNRLWYTKPAGEWIEALPLGNGRMGAMISGEPFEGQIQLNEESVVYGGPLNRINPDAKKYFPEIRRLILAGKIQEAQKLELFALSGTPQSERPYQTLCDVNYHIEHEEGEITDYKRELDLEKGVATTTFIHNGSGYLMRSLISEKEDLLAVEFSSEKEFSMSVLITRGRFYNCAGIHESKKNISAVSGTDSGCGIFYFLYCTIHSRILLCIYKLECCQNDQSEICRI